MIPLNLIHEKVNEHFHLKGDELLVKRRKKRIMYPRQIFHYISRKLNYKTLSFREIGEYCIEGNPYDHAAVMNSCKKIDGYLTYDKEVEKDIETIVKRINNHLNPESNGI